MDARDSGTGRAIGVGESLWVEGMMGSYLLIEEGFANGSRDSSGRRRRGRGRGSRHCNGLGMHKAWGDSAGLAGVML